LLSLDVPAKDLEILEASSWISTALRTDSAPHLMNCANGILVGTPSPLAFFHALLYF
jgi:hypothetical protein